AGVTRYLELGPDGILSAMARGCLDDDEGALLVPTLRRRRSETEAVTAFLAEAHVHGVEVGWTSLLGEREAPLVELPTYAFQRRRYWLDTQAGMGDVTSAGLGAANHPLLGAAVALAGEAAWLF